MSRESVETEIHRAVEEAIANNINVKEFIKIASFSWQEVLDEKKEHARTNFEKLLNMEGVY